MNTATLTIRPAGAADADALDRLAQLDSKRPPSGDVLLAEVDGEPVAAMTADGAHTVADPFRRTANVVALLRVSAASRSEPGRARPGCVPGPAPAVAGRASRRWPRRSSLRPRAAG